MKKYFPLIICMIISACGIWIGGFLGGCIAGFAGTLGLLSTLGKILAEKAAQRIDSIRANALRTK